MTPSIQQVAELALTNYACIDPRRRWVTCPQSPCTGCIFWQAFSSPRCLFWLEENKGLQRDVYTYLKLHHPEAVI